MNQAWPTPKPPLDTSATRRATRPASTSCVSWPPFRFLVAAAQSITGVEFEQLPQGRPCWKRRSRGTPGQIYTLVDLLISRTTSRAHTAVSVKGRAGDDRHLLGCGPGDASCPRSNQGQASARASNCDRSPSPSHEPITKRCLSSR